VAPALVVSSLNRMIDDANAGRTVFYDIYIDAEMNADPSRRKTGLFFFRAKPGAPFAVIAPGGGFAYVGSLHEGFPYAVEISKRGYNAFVLKYRAGQGGRIATEDLAAALSYILRNAGSLGVATTDYSLWGSSAGARMAAAIGSHGTAQFGGSALPKPSALVLLYTGHSDLAPEEPPTFVAVGDADGIAPPSVMERRVAALRRVGTDVEITSTAVWVTGLVSASGRAPKDGSPTRSASGQDRPSAAGSRQRVSSHRSATMNLSIAMLTAMALLASASTDAQTLGITRGASRPALPAPADNFTGGVRVETLFEALDPSHASGGSVTFEPGARTAWHSHPRGQILIVTAGTGRVQRWGDPIEEIRQGDVVRIPAGQKHWHGASPQASMTHIAITEHATA
jgi:quercetin dioxygenase-like cupin family protein/predicted esterase